MIPLICAVASFHPITEVQPSITFRLSSGNYDDKNTPFKLDKDFAAKVGISAADCYAEFQRKGGHFYSLDPNIPAGQKPFELLPDDIVYPSCRVGFSRSQTLWANLRTFSNLTLFAPHATRTGLDPYNGGINWRTEEVTEDHFTEYFGCEKSDRFGFEQFKDILQEKTASPDTLQEITEFYNRSYFGPTSVDADKQNNRRVYICFGQNVHVIMHRLNQTNDTLHNTVVVFIDADDCITSPPPEWNTAPRSREAYKNYSEMLKALFDTSRLQRK